MLVLEGLFLTPAMAAWLIYRRFSGTVLLSSNSWRTPGEFVHEEDAVVREDDFAGGWVAAAAKKTCIGDGMV